MTNKLTKKAMVEELKNAGIILKNVKKMTREDVEKEYNAYKNSAQNTNKEEKEMKNANAENMTPAIETVENANKEEKNMANENTENTEAVVEKKTRKHANADAVFAAIDAGLTLPEYITLIKMRDGYVFKAKNRRVAEVWKCRANVRIVTTAEHADMFDTTLCIDVNIRQRDGWVNHIVNAENIVEALENFFNAATFF